MILLNFFIVNYWYYKFVNEYNIVMVVWVLFKLYKGR